MFGRVQTERYANYTSQLIFKWKLKRLLTITEHVFKLNFAIAMESNLLTDCQSRDLNKLHFHFNASLTSVNLAKVKAIEKGSVLSMVSVKVLCHNIFLMQRFISVLGIKPNEEINRRLWEEGIKFAAIAA